MSKTGKAEKRERKSNKKRNGMRSDGKSVFIIQRAIIRRSEKAKEKSGE